MTQHPHYPDFNYDVAEKVLASVVALPDEHDQETWFDIRDWDDIPEQQVTTGTTEHDDFHGIKEVPFEERTVTANGMLEGSCGTTACLAGWAALYGGWSVITRRTELSPGIFDTDLRVISPKGEVEQDWTYSVDFELQGAEALGIPEDEASTLFMMMRREDAILAFYHIIKGGSLEDYSLWKLAQKEGIMSEDLSPHEYVEAEDLPDWEVLDRIEEELMTKVEKEYRPKFEAKVAPLVKA